MRTIVLAVVATAIGGPAIAQISGLQLGQSVSEVQAVVGAIPPVTISGSPGAAMIFRDDWLVKFCDGRVVALQYRFGTTLNAFADEVEEEAAANGEPEYDIRHGRSSEGEWSSITTVWTYENQRTVIGMSSSSRGMEATRAIAVPASLCWPML